MTEETNIPQEQSQPIAKKSWSKGLIIGGVAAVALIGAGAAALASGDDFGPRHMMGGKFMRGFMEYRMDKVLTEIGADDAQKTKLKALVTATFDSVRPARADRAAMHDEVIKLLEAPTIDRAAIEALRAKQIASLDERSKTVAKAVGDAAEILTVEQRKKLIEEMDDFGPGHGRW